MIEFTLKLLSLFLVAVGIIFIWMENLVRFDRTFMHLGVALVLFGCIPGIDIWIIPGVASPDQLLVWTRVKHILLLFLFPAILWYLNNVFKFNLGYILHFVITLMVFFLPVFFSNATLSIANGKIAYGPLYNFLFLPCAGLAGGVLVGLIGRKLKGAQGNERHILFYHLVGFSLLCAFGVIDLIVGTLSVSINLFPNYFILGVFALGLMSFFIFTERLLMLIQDRRATYNQLQIALREMDEASTLRQIGESTSIINHEIKNYLVAISGNAELIKLTENLTEDGKQSIAVIMKTINDLQNFNKDVLQLSRARIIMEKERLMIGPLIEQCIADYFSEHRQQLSITGRDRGFTIHGNWSKLEHVFVNIFKNAFEAGASEVSVNLTSTKQAFLVTIIDNGTGCSAQQLSSMFKPFYTTKKGRQGTGLGMAISRAIIESHGGHITAYTRNGLLSGNHGMQLNISLPQFTDDPKPPEPAQALIVFVKNGFENPGALLQLFNNVQVFPQIVQSAEELGKIKNIGFMNVVAAEGIFKALQKNELIKQEFLVLVSSIEGIYYAKNISPHLPLTLFSEDFIVALNEGLAK